MLAVMEECVFARKMKNLAGELVDALLHPTNEKQIQQESRSTDSAALDPSTAGQLADFPCDFHPFIFFNSNFPMIPEDIESDTFASFPIQEWSETQM
jgi:hypothetical protein